MAISSPENCPPWCRADHASQWHPADRLHLSDATEIAMVELLAHAGTAAGAAGERALSLEIALEQRIGTACPSVLLVHEAEVRQIRISPESAWRLARGLWAILEQAGARSGRAEGQ